jgi:uncharacterized protein (DUF885 family)
MTPGRDRPAGRARVAARRRPLIPSPGRGLVTLLALTLVAGAGPAAAGSMDQRLGAAGDAFVARWLARAPHEATRLGVHTSDALLVPVTETTLAEDLAWLRDFRGRLDSIPAASLGRERAVDRALLAARVERMLVDLESIHPYERDPGAYVPLVAGSVASVLERPIASPCQRLRLAARRLSQVPEILRAARINLRNPPRMLTEAAIDRFAGVLRFYRETVPTLATGCRDAPTQADLAQADSTAVRAVETFLSYLREDLLPASHGALAIGPEACRRLLHAELLDPATEPLDSSLARSRRLVEERRATLEALAAAVAPGGARAALEAQDVTPPEADELIPYMERQLGGVRRFLGEHEIVTLPERMDLGVRVAPLFRSPLALTGLDAAGAWEARAPASWLEIATPDTAWDDARRHAHLTRFGRFEAELAVIHEGVPGRFLRGVAVRGQPDRLRQVLLGAWPGEDWGEYCELMMIDEGYGSGNPGYALVAAARALRYAGRSYAALALHAGAMGPEDARAMLVEQCLLDPDDAALEVRRGAADPSVMGYTSGARQLLELRDEARQMLGPRFQIRVFNDAVLRHGASPVGIVQAGVRRELGVDDRSGSVGAKP